MPCQLHPRNQLIGNFLENLFSKVTPDHALGELDELDDVTVAWLASGVGKTTTIAIELFHLGEISAADSNNNHRAWKTR